ncbi:MAG: TIGR02147 family protein [Bdellovibrionales bacterium]|nr:TIGR02147 family protein [Bdellovibrionales bacterium]
MYLAHMKTSESDKQNKNSDFRSYLQSELIRRSEKNRNYSLRSFAKNLGMNHATLSSILAGRRPLTKKSVIKLCHQLSVSENETLNYIRSIEQTSQVPSVGPIKLHKELTLDVFMTISDWYHDAILELTHIKSFRGDYKWIATKLGITTIEVRLACERLQRLDLLSISKGGVWVDLSRNNTTNISNDLTNAALRKLQRSILELSQTALENLPRTQRDHTSLAVSIQTSDLPEVKEMIKQFRYSLAAFLERKSASPDAVFQLAISFFPLTNNLTETGDN